MRGFELLAMAVALVAVEQYRQRRTAARAVHTSEQNLP
jgi:hypothetical protein